jgi:subtilisin
MKLLRLFLFIGLLAALNACSQTTDFSRLGDSTSAEDRRLLVTFVDRTINRELSGNPLDGYRVPAQYNNSGWSERIARNLAKRHHIEFIAQWPVSELGVSCVVFEVPELLPLDKVLTDIQNDQDVSSVQRMHSFSVLGRAASQPKTYSDPYLKLQTGFRSLGIAEFHGLTTGRDIRIAIVDTGIDTNHPDLKGQINYSENVAPEANDQNLAEIHGTAVAGVLSANPNNGIGIAGIAPEAKILAFRACWPVEPKALAARCNSFTLALALNKAIRMNSHIINLSLSGPTDPLLQQLIEKAIDKGIIIIAAVPGSALAGGFPANIPGVIGVGLGGEEIHPNIIAPGQDILTTVPDQGYDFMTGSSFATPHVAGVVALLLQIHPTWQASDILEHLGNDTQILTSNLIDSAVTISTDK